MNGSPAGPDPASSIRPRQPPPPDWLHDWAHTPQRYDLLILLPNLGRGGSQRVATLLANAWAAAGYRVCIGTYSDKTPDAHTLAPGITRLKVRDFLRVLHEKRKQPRPTAPAPAPLLEPERIEPAPAAAPPAAAAAPQRPASKAAPADVPVPLPMVRAIEIAPAVAPSLPAESPPMVPSAEVPGWLAGLRTLKRGLRRGLRRALFPVREAGRMLRRLPRLLLRLGRSLLRLLRDLKRGLRRRLRQWLFPVREALRGARRGARRAGKDLYRQGQRSGRAWRALLLLPLAPLAAVAAIRRPDHLRGAFQAGRALLAAGRAHGRPLGALADHAELLRDRAKCRQVLATRLLMRHAGAPAVLAFLGSTNVIAALARHGLPARLVISERNDPARQQLQPIFEQLRPLLYGRADVVTANSLGAVDTMRAYVEPAKLLHVPNPLIVPADPGTRGHGTERRFITVSRLVPQKRVDAVIRAFAALVADGLDGWRLEILGEGPERLRLEALAAELEVGDRVDFAGHVVPFPHLFAADVYILFSSYEGLPNALLEAMACGAAAIVNDGSPGPLEYVTHEVTGLVVLSEGTDDLASAMARLARDEALRARLAAAAAARVADLSMSRVLAAWNQVLGLGSAPGAREPDRPTAGQGIAMVTHGAR